jgi:predicted PurR-regulated permease PerM
MFIIDEIFKRLLKQRKAQAVLYVVFFISAVIIIIIGAVVAPLGVSFSTKMYTAGENILNDAQPDINAIQDSEVREAVNSTIAAAKDAASTNINVSANMFQYSWIFFVIITALIVFLSARKLIEVGQGGFI